MPINYNQPKQDTVKERNPQKREIIINEIEPIYTFEDIVLNQETMDEIKYIVSMEENRDLLYNNWGLKKVFKVVKNVSVNLYGPSGTGKTMTAHAIARYLGKKLIIVNYADIESKYVGETSKNLVELFSKAETTDAVLLFDEADALLSKRVTSMNNATDVSVNQTRNVLLQQLDKYKGIVLFTTNFIQNYDTAFFRRITSHIKFSLPNEEIRRRIWEHYIVPELPLECERATFIESLVKIENVSGSDISTAVLKSAVRTAFFKGSQIKIQDVKKVLEDAVALKRVPDSGQYTVSSKQVTEEYVKEKLGKDGLVNGTISEN